MAKKVIKPLEDPLSASSSRNDDEVETSSGEDEEQITDSSSEEDEPKAPAEIPSTETLKTASASPRKTAVSAAKQGSDSDSDSETESSGKAISISAEKQGSDSDSDSETEPSGKAVAVALSAVKPKKKGGSDSAAVKSGKKRSKEGTSTDMHVKRAKKVSGDDEKKTGEGNKKPSFQRLWTEEDEISILQGIIDFKASKGKSPLDDLSSFYEVAKKSLSFAATRTQFSDKIRMLRRKYVGRKKGLESSHDEKCLGFAKSIWGSDVLAIESGVKSKRTEKKRKGEEERDKLVLGSEGMAGESAGKSGGKAKKKKKLDSKAEEEDQQTDGRAREFAPTSIGNSKKKKKKVDSKFAEEAEQVLIRGGDSESSNWFEKSFVAHSFAGLGVGESSVNLKWSKVSVESKKSIEERCKSVAAKEFDLMLEKIDILKDAGSLMSKTS